VSVVRVMTYSNLVFLTLVCDDVDASCGGRTVISMAQRRVMAKAEREWRCRHCGRYGKLRTHAVAS